MNIVAKLLEPPLMVVCISKMVQFLKYYLKQAWELEISIKIIIFLMSYQKQYHEMERNAYFF